nr:DUF2793 domain-containing protein [uncultured Brevundimonas sp.]
MSDDFSARLNLPYLAAGQMQKHVTLNTALTRLDALLQTAVLSRTTAIQPTDASDGDLYILPPEAEGAAWAGRPAGTLMRFEGGGWTTVTTPDGMIACVLDEGVVVVRARAGWIALGQRLGEVQRLTRLGLGTTADDANPLAAKINAALFTARGEEEGGDDAGTWRSVWRVDRATGRIAFDQGAIRRETTLFTSDDDYAQPAWARWVEATCLGGGGGGGAGLAGPAGAPRLGGGGGGAGGLSLARWSADDLDGVLSVMVGGGGISGVSGGDSEVATGDMVLLRATGGAAGGSGVGGAGGIGQRPANPGGGSSTTATATTGAETVCADGPGGGGAGGGLSAADVAYAGGAGGVGGWSGLRAAGGVAGAAGQASPKPLLSIVGGGCGGGDASASGAGGPGGAGAHFGAGGGGGGAGLTFGGQGGSGASGAVLITVVG